MSKLFSLVLSGIVTGGLFAILSSGLVLTYQVAGVFNFATGATAFVSALMFFELNTGAGWSIVPAALVTILIFAPLLGVLLDYAMLRKLARAGITAQIVATIGLTIALPAAGLFIVDEAGLTTTTNVTSPPGVGPVPAEVWHLTSRVSFDSTKLSILSAAAFTAIVLWIVVRLTPLGLQMRACVDRRDLASLRGVNPGRSSLIASVLSTTLAGLVGVLGAPILNLSPDLYTGAMLAAAGAAVFARFTSIPLAFFFGLLLGVIENLVAGYVSPHISFQGLSSSTPYILIFVGLLLLNATRARRAGTVSDEKMRDLDISGLPLWRRTWPWIVSGVGLLIWIFVANDIWLGYTITGLSLAIVFVSFVLVTGIGGMVSLAQATFVTAAALSAGFFISHGWPFVLALLAGTAVAGVVGALVSLPALRLGGLPLALSTLAIAYVGDLLVFQLDPVRNQTLGWTIPRPHWFGINFDGLLPNGDRNFALLAFVFVLIAVWLVRNLERSPSGRAMLALRSSSVAAEASGVSTARQKFTLFTISAAMAGFGGIMYASYNGAANNTDHPATEGLIWLAVVVAFGVRRPGSAVIAGLVYGLSPHIFNDYISTSTYLVTMLFGLGGVGLAKNPEGFLVDTVDSFRQLGRKLSARRAPAAEPVMAGASTPADRLTKPEAEAVATADGDTSVVGLEKAATVPAVPSQPTVSATTGAAGSELPPSDALLQVRGLRAGYDGIEVLHGIDFDVSAGSIVAVLGPNGAGKTTLCSVINGLVPADAGTVTLGGTDVTTWAPYRRSRSGLVLAPESRGIFTGLTVEENLRLVLNASERESVYERFTALRERRRLPAGVLSGGEQQMLTLAPLLAKPPRVLIADEPSLGLAPLVIEQVMEILREIAAAGCAVLLVEEKLHGIAHVAESVIALDLGRVAWTRAASEVDAAALAATYLGVDRATAKQLETAASGTGVGAGST
jgi:ABC-type branched-subunit amino acid transport system ATPase component/branched-subunit amino acid ABC-type transport system permease component